MNLELIRHIYYLEKEIERLETLETAPSVDDAGAITLIETKTLAAPTITISFSAIPATYTHLFFIGSVRTDVVTELDQIEIGFNSIVLPNAAFDMFASGHVGGGGFSGNLAQRLTAGYCAGSLCPANYFTPFEFWVYFYAMTDRTRQVTSAGAYGKDATAPDIEAVRQVGCGHWKNTAVAVNEVHFEPRLRAGNMETGTQISMFGISGS